MGIQLHHPVTGNTITVDDERAVVVHAESGWEVVDTPGEPAPAPARPADDAPGRKWLAYAQALGIDVDETQIGSVDELIALIDQHDPAPATTDGGAGMPDHADELIAWIGDDPDRARAAQDAEAGRPSTRKTVTEHIASVLDDPSQED